jgi:hypothetical protein
MEYIKPRGYFKATTQYWPLVIKTILSFLVVVTLIVKKWLGTTWGFPGILRLLIVNLQPATDFASWPSPTAMWAWSVSTFLTRMEESSHHQEDLTHYLGSSRRCDRVQSLLFPQQQNNLESACEGRPVQHDGLCRCAIQQDLPSKIEEVDGTGSKVGEDNIRAILQSGSRQADLTQRR